VLSGGENVKWAPKRKKHHRVSSISNKGSPGDFNLERTGWARSCPTGGAPKPIKKSNHKDREKGEPELPDHTRNPVLPVGDRPPGERGKQNGLNLNARYWARLSHKIPRPQKRSRRRRREYWEEGGGPLCKWANHRADELPGQNLCDLGGERTYRANITISN